MTRVIHADMLQAIPRMVADGVVCDAVVTDILERMAHYEGSGKHSLASKGRQARPRGEAPLFDQPYDETADAIGSYNEAVKAIGAKVRAGEPLPAFFQPGTAE